MSVKSSTGSMPNSEQGSDIQRENEILRSQISAQTVANAKVRIQLKQQQRSLEVALHEKQMQIERLEARVQAIVNTKGWRALEWFRRKRNKLRSAMRLVRRSFSVLLREGPLVLVRKVRRTVRESILQHSIASGAVDPYQVWLHHNSLNDYQVRQMYEEMRKFEYLPKVSIVMPVYNVELKWLQKAVSSVVSQIYPVWELCIVDDASTVEDIHAYLQDISQDARIRVKLLEKNLGISKAYNTGIKMAKGDFICFLDHDDELSPDALYEVVRLLQVEDADFIYSDEDRTDENNNRLEPHFRPDWSPDMLLSHLYCVHLNVYRRSIVEQIGAVDESYPVSQDYDFILRFTEQTNRIKHIPKILYHWRILGTSTSHRNQERVSEHSRRAIQAHLDRSGIKGSVEDGLAFNIFRVRREILGLPKVSVIIPTKDKIEYLRKCVNSILNNTLYQNYEIIIVDNGSVQAETHRYYEELSQEKRVRVIPYDDKFNFSAINNYAARLAEGEHLLFLNNDVEVISGEWMTAMLEHSQRPEVGIVGAKLYYGNDTIQHAGVVLGLGGLADHGHRSHVGDSPGYAHYLYMIRNYSIVTAGCAMMRKSLFEEVGGFDEENLAVAFNDVDLCLRLRDQGYLVVWTPYAELYHYESVSRGYDVDPEEVRYMMDRWKEALIKGDPYYNPNLSLNGVGYSYKMAPVV